MNEQDAWRHATTKRGSDPAIEVPCILKGEVRFGSEVEHRLRAGSTSVFTPTIPLNDLVWSRHELTPAFHTPIDDILDFLAEVGNQLDFDRNPYLADALEKMVHFSPLDARILENGYRDIKLMFERDAMVAEILQSLGSLDVLDTWTARNPYLPDTLIRAVPPRMVHIMAGNAPQVAPISIVRGALTKGVHLLKLPSNDMFTATAILRTMADVDPRHPTTRSFTAVYWRGGATDIESAIFRSQYFDKIVVWGGYAAVKHVVQYIGPGLEMISFDPKVSCSFIGTEAFQSPETLREIALCAAADVIGWNQDACSASRFQYVEGTDEQVDRYCEALVQAMAEDTPYGPGRSTLLPAPEVREELEVLRELEPLFRVFGAYDGNGMVVRSDQPVSFHPSGKLVNVVRVDKLEDAVKFMGVASQTVGIYPESALISLRDHLAASGVQRIVQLGKVNGPGGLGGLPHDAGIPLNRYMRWVFQQGTQRGVNSYPATEIVQ